MHKRIMTAAIALALAAPLSGCGERIEDGPKAGDDVAVPAFTWRVRAAENLAEQYRAAGKDPGANAQAEGFIGRDQNTGALVVYTKPPRYVDDSVACTLGHEVMHAALGDYHRHREAK
jgi:hypothetical protein